MVRYAFHMTEKQHDALIVESTSRGIGIPELLRRIIDAWAGDTVYCPECRTISEKTCSEESHGRLSGEK